MIRDHLEFHNVAELEDLGPLGLRLQRFPREVRCHPGMNELGRVVMQKAIGAEIRFVTEAPRVRISLGAMDRDNQVTVLRGDFVVETVTVRAGTVTHLLLQQPEAFGYMKPSFYADCRFTPDVWRVWTGQECALYLGIDTYGYPCRPPTAQEKPRARWMAYGSSFTMGGGTINHLGNYVDTAGRLAKLDGINLGMGGSCHCEDHVADHLAARTDWDVCTLRVGCNMIGVIEPEEYRRRVARLVDGLTSRHPGKPVLLIGLGTRSLDHNKEHKVWQNHTLAYDRINRELIDARRGVESLHFCSQDDLLPHPTFLRADHLHPDDLGQFVMATNLAARLRELIPFTRG